MRDEILIQLQQQVSQKQHLESKLSQLKNQRIIYDRNAVALRLACRQAQEDLDKLEGRSLANYFFQVVGRLDDKLDQQRREAYAARVKLDGAERELAGIEQDIQEVNRQLSEIRSAQVQYETELLRKGMELRASGSPVGERMIALEQKIGLLKAQKKEIKEAISAGRSAKAVADSVLSELDSAEGWNTWDLVGGGGILTHVAKHSHLDGAQDLVQELQRKLRQFKTELADIQIDANLQVNVEGFLRFADYFFDGLFADWAVGDRISESQSSVQRTKDQISQMLRKLSDMEQETEREIGTLSAQLDELIVKG